MKGLAISLFLFATSCMNSDPHLMGFAEFSYKITNEWIYAEEILDLKLNNQVILRPPGVEQLIMTVAILEDGGSGIKNNCVYYSVPYKERPGILRVVEIKNVKECPQNSESEMAFASLQGMDNLKMAFNGFKINLSFSFQGESKTIEIPTPNISTGHAHEKYKAMTEKRLWSGMKFMRITEESFDNSTNPYLGRMSDRFSKGSAIRCHQVNKECQTVGENRCKDCRYGWYEVVDFQCPQGGSKFCGLNHCGEKNEPACPRGVKVVDPADAGICQSDLEPRLNPDKILLCL